MKFKFTKQVQLTLTYFIPVFVIFSLFTVFVIFSYSEQIYQLDEVITEVAFEQNGQDLEYGNHDQIIFGQESGGLLEQEFNYVPEREYFEYENYYYSLEDGSLIEEYDYYPSFSVDDLEDIQDEIYSSLLKNIFYILFVITFLFAVLAYYFARKVLHPLEVALAKQKQFVSDASHEIKTPLALMKTEAEVLLRNKDIDIKEYISFTKHTVNDIDRLDGLTVSLLELAQMDQDKKKIKLESKDVETSLVEAVDSFKNTLLKEKNIKINIDSGSQVNFCIDVFLFNQVIHIILDNAVKYAEQNTDITINFARHDKLARLVIKNTGPTIPQTDLPYVFDRFYRVSQDRNTSGYGLGLAIANESMNLQKGEITITSENNSTAVTLRFKNNGC